MSAVTASRVASANRAANRCRIADVYGNPMNAAHPARFEHDRARSVEDMQLIMQREQGVRPTSPLVISRYEQDRHTTERDALQRRE